MLFLIVKWYVYIDVLNWRIMINSIVLLEFSFDLYNYKSRMNLEILFHASVLFWDIS